MSTGLVGGGASTNYQGPGGLERGPGFASILETSSKNLSLEKRAAFLGWLDLQVSDPYWACPSLLAGCAEVNPNRLGYRPEQKTTSLPSSLWPTNALGCHCPVCFLCPLGSHTGTTLGPLCKSQGCTPGQSRLARM